MTLCHFTLSLHLPLLIVYSKFRLGPPPRTSAPDLRPGTRPRTPSCVWVLLVSHPGAPGPGALFRTYATSPVQPTRLHCINEFIWLYSIQYEGCDQYTIVQINGIIFIVSSLGLRHMIQGYQVFQIKESNSPDLNPIKNLWSIIKTQLRKRDCTTKTMLVEATIGVWFRNPEIHKNCQHLVTLDAKSNSRHSAEQGRLCKCNVLKLTQKTSNINLSHETVFLFMIYDRFVKLICTIYKCQY